MPKPFFEQLDVECWAFDGKLGFTQPTICLFHSKTELGQPILLALDELRADSTPAQRVMTFKTSNRTRSISILRLRLEPAAEELRIMNIMCCGESVTIKMTEIGLKLVRDAVSAWCRGAEDFGVWPDQSSIEKRELGPLDRSSGELWFWGPIMEP